jgi:formamidopyrimidine-DNA glycosylase
MPEGPEVCILAQYLSTKLKDRLMGKLTILSGKYYSKFDLTNKELLSGSENDGLYIIEKIDSKGKLMFFVLKNNKTNAYIYLTSHLGMGGFWSFKSDESNDRLKIEIKNTNNDKKYYLIYNDPRNFGNINILTNKNIFEQKLNNLAPDALKTDFNNILFIKWVKEFLKKSSKRSNMYIANVLKEQTTKLGIVSGIGNYLMAEILYDAKISPFRTIGSLTNIDLNTLAQSIKYIIKLSYYNNTTGYMTNFADFIKIHKQKIDDNKYPNYHPDIILKKTDKFEFKIYGKDLDPLGNIVEKDITIDKQGRTTHWVPAIQK